MMFEVRSRNKIVFSGSFEEARDVAQETGGSIHRAKEVPDEAPPWEKASDEKPKAEVASQASDETPEQEINMAGVAILPQFGVVIVPLPLWREMTEDDV